MLKIPTSKAHNRRRDLKKYNIGITQLCTLKFYNNNNALAIFLLEKPEKQPA